MMPLFRTVNLPFLFLEAGSQKVVLNNFKKKSKMKNNLVSSYDSFTLYLIETLLQTGQTQIRQLL